MCMDYYCLLSLFSGFVVSVTFVPRSIVKWSAQFEKNKFSPFHKLKESGNIIM